MSNGSLATTGLDESDTREEVRGSTDDPTAEAAEISRRLQTK